MKSEESETEMLNRRGLIEWYSNDEIMQIDYLMRLNELHMASYVKQPILMAAKQLFARRLFEEYKTLDDEYNTLWNTCSKLSEGNQDRGRQLCDLTYGFETIYTLNQNKNDESFMELLKQLDYSNDLKEKKLKEIQNEKDYLMLKYFTILHDGYDDIANKEEFPIKHTNLSGEEFIAVPYHYRQIYYMQYQPQNVTEMNNGKIF